MTKTAKHLKACGCGCTGSWKFHQTAWVPAMLPRAQRALAAGAAVTDAAKPGQVGLDTYICTQCGSSALDVPSN